MDEYSLIQTEQTTTNIFMIADLIGFVEFHLTLMTEISGRSMKDIKVIAMDEKI